MKNIGRYSLQSTSAGAGKAGYIKLSGLVWDANEFQVKNLLSDCSVIHVHLCVNDNGKRSGEAMVKLADENDVKKAIGHNREKIGKVVKFQVRIDRFEEL